MLAGIDPLAQILAERFHTAADQVTHPFDLGRNPVHVLRLAVFAGGQFLPHLVEAGLEFGHRFVIRIFGGARDFIGQFRASRVHCGAHRGHDLFKARLEFGAQAVCEVGIHRFRQGLDLGVQIVEGRFKAEQGGIRGRLGPVQALLRAGQGRLHGLQGLGHAGLDAFQPLIGLVDAGKAQVHMGFQIRQPVSKFAGRSLGAKFSLVHRPLDA